MDFEQEIKLIWYIFYCSIAHKNVHAKKNIGNGFNVEKINSVSVINTKQPQNIKLYYTHSNSISSIFLRKQIHQIKMPPLITSERKLLS